MDKEKATVFKYYDKEDLEAWKRMKKKRWGTLVKNMLVKKFRIQIVYVLDKLGIGK